MSLQAFLDNLLSFIEKAASHVKHYCLKLYFPFILGLVLCIKHNLNSSSVFTNHLKVLRILKESSAHLLWRHIKTSSLQTKTCLIHLTLVLHQSRCNHPYLPLYIVGAFHDSSLEIFVCLLLKTKPLIGLRELDIDLPLELLADV